MEGEKPQDMEEIAEEAAADEPKKDEPEVFSENDTQDDSLDPDEERDLREHVAGLLKSDEDPVLAQLETINAIAQNVEEGMYSEEVARRLLEEAGVPTSDIDDRFNRDKPEGADGEEPMRDTTYDDIRKEVPIPVEREILGGIIEDMMSLDDDRVINVQNTLWHVRTMVDSGEAKKDEAIALLIEAGISVEEIEDEFEEELWEEM